MILVNVLSELDQVISKVPLFSVSDSYHEKVNSSQRTHYKDIEPLRAFSVFILTSALVCLAFRHSR
jgi:hypothetical protein